MKRDIGDRVLDHDARTRFAHGNFAPGAAVDFFRAEILLRNLISPIAKRALGKLHDVAFVDERYAFAVVLDRVGNRAVNQAYAARAADRFDADPHANIVAFRRADFFPEIGRLLPGAKANFIELLRKFFLEKIENLLRFRCARGVFDPRINVFRVFPEDHHIHFLRMLDGRGDAFEVLHRPQAYEKIEKLTERHIERTNAAAYRRCQRPFDANQKFAERFHCVIRQPFVEFVFCRLTREYLKPRDLFVAAVRFFDRCIKHTNAGCPDIRPRAVPTDEWDDRLIRHVEGSFVDRNLLAGWRRDVFIRHRAQL